MGAPELRQFGDLDVEDFERHPVWIGCHTADYGKPWYGQTDEETFRPWTGKLPVDPAEGMFLVQAVFELRDGSRFPGFVTPVIDSAIGGLGPSGHLLGTQQPQIFVRDQTFAFWGGMIGVAREAQQDLYTALKKTPDSIFPLRFSTDLGLTTGIATGQLDGFYRSSREGIEVTIAEPVDEHESGEAAGIAHLYWMAAKSWQGYPMPGGHSNFLMRYKKVNYGQVCKRCGIYDEQIAPFRFAKTSRKEFAGFMQLNAVDDAFFLRLELADEIRKAEIRGVSFGPAVDHRTGVELTDRVQMLFSTIIPCAEVSQLPPVTCRPENEEVLSIRALFAKQPPRPEWQGKSVLSPELKEKIRRDGERIAALPYCGRVKYHWPTSLALVPDNLTHAPDLFQTAEWFGSGAAACRFTIASERFVKLAQERRWKGLAFHRASQRGHSE